MQVNGSKNIPKTVIPFSSLSWIITHRPPVIHVDAIRDWFPYYEFGQDLEGETVRLVDPKTQEYLDIMIGHMAYDLTSGEVREYVIINSSPIQLELEGI